MKKSTVFLMMLLGIFVLAACSSTQAVENGGETAVMPEKSDDMMVDDMAESEDAMSDDKDDMMAESEHDTDMAEETMTDDAMADDSMSEDAMSDDAMSDDAMSDDTMSDDKDDMMMELPAWQTIALTNAATGETFTLADFAGKTVFVEPMATWCTNCRSQLTNVREARSQFGDEVVFVGLSLETNISDEELAAYQSNEGFDWTFAVMSPELLQSLADTFGRSITSAPSTPHFIIRPDGSYTELVTGIDTPDVLVQQIQAVQ
ncbi:MAG: redoxin domain-containing protein [Anaerolineae bacterium]|nr:redoxin domain-containing protein [Anaerolineae bacterium]